MVEICWNVLGGSPNVLLLTRRSILLLVKLGYALKHLVVDVRLILQQTKKEKEYGHENGGVEVGIGEIEFDFLLLLLLRRAVAFRLRGLRTVTAEVPGSCNTRCRSAPSSLPLPSSSCSARLVILGIPRRLLPPIATAAEYFILLVVLLHVQEI